MVLGVPVSSNLPHAWLALTSAEQLEILNTQSFEGPVLVFKHSSRCSISDIALRRLNLKTVEPVLAERLPCYFLDLIKFPALSQEVAYRYKVFHESPQLLLIKDGQCIYESSHLDISVTELEEQIVYP